uniref:XRRM domain-containing protein n=1 Tax=Panagrolaimus superbus TaxID=310955 RepID=A0A914Y1U9_9BILA
MRVAGLPIENIDFNVIKEFFMQYGIVAYADYTDGTSDACIRFEPDEENIAIKVLEKINETAKKSNGKVIFNGTEIECKVLEGEEEKKYWNDYKIAYEACKRGTKRPYFQRGNRFKNKRPRIDETYRLKRKEENCRLKELRLKKKKLRNKKN